MPAEESMKRAVALLFVFAVSASPQPQPKRAFALSDWYRVSSPGVESTNPRWSPDGKLLIFNSSRTGSASGLWVARMDEPSGDAQPFDQKSFRTGSMPADRGFMVYGPAPDRAAPPAAF